MKQLTLCLCILSLCALPVFGCGADSGGGGDAGPGTPDAVIGDDTTGDDAAGGDVTPPEDTDTPPEDTDTPPEDAVVHVDTGPDLEPTLCETYCELANNVCTDKNAIPFSDDGCLADCSWFPEGDDGDVDVDSLYCRLYHLDAAIGDPETHCPHASPHGGGMCTDAVWNDGDCCEPADGMVGCGDDEVEACVCAEDAYCCDTEWDSYCVSEVAEFGCAVCEEPVPACETYCTLAETNCADDNAIDFGEEGCLATCETWPAGEAGDTNGNTAQCRIYHADAAAEDAALHCPHAGPDGGGVCVDPEPNDGDCCLAAEGALIGCGDDEVEACVCAEDAFCCEVEWDSFCVSEVEEFGCAVCEEPLTPCETYCELTTANCTEDNAITYGDDGCLADCAAWPEGEEGDMGGINSVHCRIYHAGAAAEDAATHCPHAGPDGGGVCVDPPPPTPCEIYCDLTATNCTEDNAITYGDEGCLADCAAWPEGEEGDVAGNTTQCRIYHAGAAADDAGLHCPHAGPDGGGVCVDPEPFTISQCWDENCEAEVAACEANADCVTFAACMKDSDDWGLCATEVMNEEATDLYAEIQYCGWMACPITEGTCEGVCGDYVGPLTCNCDVTICLGEDGACLGTPQDPTDGELYGCGYYGDCCVDYDDLCVEPEPFQDCAADGQACDLAASQPVGYVCVSGTEGNGWCRMACSTFNDSCEVGTECITDDDVTGAGFCAAENCSGLMTDDCGPGATCYIMGDTGSCIVNGSGAEGDACLSGNECAMGMYCLNDECTIPGCTDDGLKDCTDEGDICLVYTYTASGEEADAGDCYTPCTPWINDGCGAAEWCNPITPTGGVEGICVDSSGGVAQAGEPCSDASPCADGNLCLDAGGGTMCYALCEPGAEPIDAGWCQADTCLPLFFQSGAVAIFGYCGLYTGPGGVTDCCTEDASSQGCNDAYTETCVCAFDAYCCDTSWDANCSSAVEPTGCGTCPE